MDSEKEYPRQETFALSLRVWHPTISAKDIAESLSLRATRICIVGEPRATPTGKPLNGVYPDNFYVGQVIEHEEFEYPGFDRDLDACLALALDRLQPSLDAIKGLRDASARMEFFIGWTIRGHGGADLAPTLLARLGNLGIGLSLDVYGKSSQGEQ